MSETVMVTGGTGYVASWCIVALLERGYTVRTTLRSIAKEPELRIAISSVTEIGDRLTCFAADLTHDDGWDAAMNGCVYVLHVASPLGGTNTPTDNSFAAPAVEGTLRVLRAATNARVKRVVVTSAATVATPPLHTPDSISDETVWFDPSDPDIDPYRRSKRLAERAAWDFMRGYQGATTMTTILPSAVFGPVLKRNTLGSVQVIGRLLNGSVAANPRLGFEVVDVRDLADLYIRVMISPRAAGERFLACGEFLWMADISRLLREHLGTAAAKVPTKNLPNFVFRLMSLVNPSLRSMTPRLGRMHRHTSAKARKLLGWQPRAAAETIIECGRSLTGIRAP